MEKILDRFLRYISVDTQSDENSESQPSTAKQLNLLSMLRDELQTMGLEATLDEYGYVMATIPSNISQKVPKIGFIAHVDTAPDASGADIKPQIIENYDGKEIEPDGLPSPSLLSMRILGSQNSLSIIRDAECEIIGDSIVCCWIPYLVKDKFFFVDIKAFMD